MENNFNVLKFRQSRTRCRNYRGSDDPREPFISAPMVFYPQNSLYLHRSRNARTATTPLLFYMFNFYNKPTRVDSHLRVISGYIINICSSTAFLRYFRETDDAVFWQFSSRSSHYTRVIQFASSSCVEDSGHLVVILKQLNDDLDVVVVVLDGDDAQNVGSVFRIRIFAVLVRQHQARVGLFDLPDS